jgi:hypothetical protein
MQRSTFGRWLVAAYAAVFAVTLTTLVPGSDRVMAATGSELGRYVAGSGTLEDSPAPGSTTTISVDASIAWDGFVSGSYEMSIDGGPTTSGPVTCMWVTGSAALLGLGEWDQGRQLVSIGDNDSTGDTLWIDVTGQYGGDCTLGPHPGTEIASGNFIVTGLPMPSIGESGQPSELPSPTPPLGTQSGDDANGDGIADTLQPGVPYGSFVDATLTPPTSGSIVSSGGLSVNITDAPYPDGVVISAGSEVPGAEAELSLCGFTVMLAAGTSTYATCGSVILEVVTGAASVVLGGGLTVVGIPAGGTASVSDSGDGGFVVENLGGGSVGVTITVGGTTSTVAPGEARTAEAWSFLGFGPPIDNLPTVNTMKAGQAVPLRWRLLDATGAPVLDLLSAGLTSSTLGCSTSGTTDQVEEVTTGASSLQNLGEGRYQLNWKTAKSYAGTCRTLHLDVGDGVTHDARFSFTR